MIMFVNCGEGGVVQRSLQREKDSGDNGKLVGQVQNEEHLCLIAVIGVERPNKATVERELEERDGVETRAHGL